MNHIRITFRYEGGITAATAVVEALRQRALTLPFHSVDSGLYPFWLFSGERCAHLPDALADHFQFNLAIHNTIIDSTRLATIIERFGDSNSFHNCIRNRGVAFSVMPNQWTLPVSFGLFCKIPFRHHGQWTWRTFIPALDFTGTLTRSCLKHHLALIRLVDHASELGLVHQIVDPTGYFESRNRALLTGGDRHLDRFVAQIEANLWPRGNRPKVA